MLPNLNRLTLVPTAGNLANAKWDEDEACSICLFPLGQPSPDERYTWPFSGDGTGFTAVACVQGHTFHKGCLRFMMRFSDRSCPDCRKPMFAEVLKDVSRPDAEQAEREARQARERERARQAREREDRERQQQQPNPNASSGFGYVPSLAEVEAVRMRAARLQEMGFVHGEPGPQDPNDYLLQWTFRVKGHVASENASVQMRAHFGTHMRVRWQWEGGGEGQWRRRLAITVDATERIFEADVDNPEAEARDANMPTTKIRCKLYLPMERAHSFARWFEGKVRDHGYAEAIKRLLGISTAIPVGMVVANYGAIDDHEAHAVNTGQDNAFQMSEAQYADWPHHAFHPGYALALGPLSPRMVPPPPPPGMPPGYVAVPTTDRSLSVVQWTFFVKGHVPQPSGGVGRLPEPIWMHVRGIFEEVVHEEWADVNSIDNLGTRLAFLVRHEFFHPTDENAVNNAPRQISRCRIRLHLPEDAARAFAEWLSGFIASWGYEGAMDIMLGIESAKPAGVAPVVTMSGTFVPDNPTAMRNQDEAQPLMTAAEYEAWPEFTTRASRAAAGAAGPSNAPAPAAAPRRQANWMWEEAEAEMRADDPITAFRPQGWAATDVTIRWRFWLKGPMNGVERSNDPMHWRRAFADAMRDAEGLPEMRTSADPWFDRLWVWTRAEEPRITGPRSGQPLVPGIVERCEFVLKLPADVASAWLTVVAQAFGSASWNALAMTWFYVEPVMSSGTRDRPSLDSSPLHPLSGAPAMTEAEYNAWGTWRSIPRFRTIGEDRY